MCVVSMVMDHYRERWEPLVPQVPYQPIVTNPTIISWPVPMISAEEVAEFRKLLERAREYDKRMNEPDCELDEKKAALKDIAQKLGVEIAFL